MGQARFGHAGRVAVQLIGMSAALRGDPVEVACVHVLGSLVANPVRGVSDASANVAVEVRVVVQRLYEGFEGGPVGAHSRFAEACGGWDGGRRSERRVDVGLCDRGWGGVSGVIDLWVGHDAKHA